MGPSPSRGLVNTWWNQIWHSLFHARWACPSLHVFTWNLSPLNLYWVYTRLPPPDIALECICQTALGFPASWRIIAPGSKQDSSIFRVVPRGTCKMQAQSRFLPTNHYAWWFTHVQKSLLSVNLYRKTSVCSYQVCIGLLKVYTFITGGISSEKTPGDMWTLYELSINLV